MKLLKWTDEYGFNRQSWVKDADMEPDYGIPHDPPDFSDAGLSPDQCRELHNRLVDEGLITHLDVLRGGGRVSAILRQMGLKKYRRQVLTQYKLDRR